MSMSRRLKFTTLDVFTSTPYLGNPLAIVHVPSTVELTQAQKQLIAREFNLSETVFLHEQDTIDAETPVEIDIFTALEELPFAGHPTVGTGFYLLSQAPLVDTATLRTKAGDIPVVRTSAGGARLQVPIDFKVHPWQTIASVKQAHLTDADFVRGRAEAEACVSIVKGMTFLLLQLASEDALARMKPYPQRLEIPNKETALGAWGVGFHGVYAWYEREDGSVRTRMFDGSLEDPATGSAASALGGFLGTRRGPAVHTIDIIQGVEMGRRSDIRVVVDIGKDREVKKIELEGAAVPIMEGWVSI